MADSVINLILKGQDQAASATIRAVSSELDDLDDTARGVSDSTEEMDSSTQQAGRGLGNLTTLAMGAGVALGGALAAGLVTAINLGSDAEESMAKFNVVFANIEGGPERLAGEMDVLAQATGRSKYELIGMAAGMGDLFQPLGFSADESARLSTEVTGLAIDLSSFNNMPMDEALERLRGTLIGSHENALAFGVVINENTLAAKMHEMGLDTLTGAALEQAKVQARYQLILEGTTAAQGDAVRTADGFANQLRALQATATDFATEVGAEVLPIVTELTGNFRELAGETLPELKVVISETVGLFGDMRGELGETSDGVEGFGDALSGLADYIGFVRDTRDEMTLLNEVTGDTQGQFDLAQRAFGLAKGGLSAFYQVVVEGHDPLREMGALTGDYLEMMSDWPVVGGLAQSALDMYTTELERGSLAADKNEQEHEQLAGSVERSTSAYDRGREAVSQFNAMMEFGEDTTRAAAASYFSLTQDAITPMGIQLFETELKLRSFGVGVTEDTRELEDMYYATIPATEATTGLGDAVATTTGLILPGAEALATYSNRMGDYFVQAQNAGTGSDDLEAQLYELIIAGDGSATSFAAAGLGLGVFTEDMAEAYLKGAILRDRMDEIKERFLNGQISAAQLRTELSNAITEVQSMSINVNEATGSVSIFNENLITTTQSTDSLIAKFGEVPDEVETEFILNDEEAIGSVSTYKDYLNGIPANVTTTVTTNYVNTGEGGQAHGGTQTGLAEGTDYWRGGWTVVGEEGPELVNLPRGSQVYPEDETDRMLNQRGPLRSGSGSQQNTYQTIFQPGSVIINDTAAMQMLLSFLEGNIQTRALGAI